MKMLWYKKDILCFSRVDGAIEFIDDNGKLIKTVEGIHKACINSMIINAEGVILTCCDEGRLGRLN